MGDGASWANRSSKSEEIRPRTNPGPPLLFWVLQLILFLGIASTAVGYLGCFTVVQRETPTNTYIWLGVEITLAILRICIWGSNPRWDEHTGVGLKLKLADIAPIITTGRNYRQDIEGDLNKPFARYVALDESFPDDFPVDYAHHELFIAVDDGPFLDYVASYTGPLE
jgi:hypothetical protein